MREILLSLGASLAVMTSVSSNAANPELARAVYLREDGRGILSESDIADERGTAYREDRSLGYWTCFDAKDVSIGCIDMGFTNDGRMADLDFKALRSGEWHYYTYRHLIGLSICRQQLKKWKALGNRQARTCVQGEYAGVDDQVDGSGSVF